MWGISLLMQQISVSKKWATEPQEVALTDVSKEYCLCGGTVSLSALFSKDSYKEFEINQICAANSDFDVILENLVRSLDDGNAEILFSAKEIYDLALLTEILDGDEYFSRAKVITYEMHANDLKLLKYFSASTVKRNIMKYLIYCSVGINYFLNGCFFVFSQNKFLLDKVLIYQ